MRQDGEIRFGYEKTNLKLGDKALLAFSTHDPLDIYERPDGRGSFTYRLEGKINRGGLTAAGLEELLKSLLD